MSLGFRQLRYFVAVAEAGAISRAAQTLNIAQSAISLHIAECEATLGVALFERRPRGVVLTAAGRHLHAHAKAILTALDKAETDVKNFTELPSGPVSLGLSYTVAGAASLPIMQTINTECPDIHLAVSEGLSPSLTQRVLAGTLDCAVVYNPPDDTRLIRVHLLDEELFLVGQKRLIGRSQTPVAFADIPQNLVLGLNPVPASRAIINAQILRNQITPHPRLEIDSLNALRQALVAGLGCAIIARSTIAAELAAGRLHARRIVDPPLTRALKIVALADRPQTRALAEVTRLLREVFEEEVKSNRWPVS